MRNLPLAAIVSMVIGLAGWSNAVLAGTQGRSATLSWNPPTSNADGSTMSDLVGYRIYYGKSPTKLNQTIVIDNPGLTRYLVENLAPAKWHFAMTAVNSSGKESALSKTVSKKIV